MQEMDVEQVMARIRDSISARRSVEKGGEIPQGVAPNGHEPADVAHLDSLCDIRKIEFTSHRPVVGWVVVVLKKILRKLLTPILERQIAYNEAGVQAIESLQRQLRREVGVKSQEVVAAESRLREVLTTHGHDMVAIRATVAQALQAIQALQALPAPPTRDEITANQSHAIREMSEAVYLRIARAERKLRRILHVLEADRPRESTAAETSVEETPRPPLRELEPEFDYAGFEDRYRGSEEDIKGRQQIYVKYYQGRADVLDIGCGRGEFLDLLREHDIKARGIDLDLDMVLACRDKGLDVARTDAFAYLAALPDDSLGGVFAAQVIEHLRPRRVIELVKLCQRKLAPGAALVLETPNPACLMVFADSFYRDLSHEQPIHPETMKFLLEATGFQGVELAFLAPVEAAQRLPRLELPGGAHDDFNRGIDRLNTLLFGPRDYAVIGRKGWMARPDA